MNFTFLCLFIVQWLSCQVYAVYNKDVICEIDPGKSPVCKTIRRTLRRSDGLHKVIPSHDPYIPRINTIFFNCTAPQCSLTKLESISHVTDPNLVLKSCHEAQTSHNYECETIRYNYFKNVDKLLFLSNNIQDKTFYLVDCLVYTDGERVCHKKDGADSYTKLVDTGTMARPKEADNVLAQDEFICEEGKNKEVNCDLDPFTPFDDGLKLKERVKFENNILLKTGNYVVILKKNCIGEWCGFSGSLAPSRRDSGRFPYEPPGGWVYRCYYANKQQICKPLHSTYHQTYDERDWIDT